MLTYEYSLYVALYHILLLSLLLITANFVAFRAIFTNCSSDRFPLDGQSQ